MEKTETPFKRLGRPKDGELTGVAHKLRDHSMSVFEAESEISMQTIQIQTIPLCIRQRAALPVSLLKLEQMC